MTFLLAAALALATPPGLIHETLPNGLEVTILPVPDNPVVATQVWYHVGAANEEPKTRGFAHLFEHLMFGATSSHDQREYAEHHRRYGGRENAYTSWDETVYVSEIPPGGHARVLELEADRMVHLALTEENLANEKKIVTEELRLRTENDPFSRVAISALKAVLGEHPYAVTPAGTREDIAAATLDHAREFYARYYRPKNAHLVVVGPVDGPATLRRVRETFGPLPADGTTPADVPPLLGWKSPAEVDLTEDLPPVEIAVLIFPLPPPSAQDRWSLLVLQQLLTRSAVDPFREDLVRGRNKAVEAGIEFYDLRRGGALFFYSAALPYRRKASAFRFMDQALAGMARLDWLTDESVAAAKRRLLREEGGRTWFADSRADALGKARWWLGDPRRALGAADAIGGVTRADVARVYETYIARATPVRVYLRPERVPVLVRLFGWLYPLVSR